ncbi:MAG: type II secretion system F family protein [Firmicutes bacterium]|nr:type II secretion system F family protein [Bacillota bacterium]
MTAQVIALLTVGSVFFALHALLSHLSRHKEEVAQRLLHITGQFSGAKTQNAGREDGSRHPSLFLLWRKLAPKGLLEAAEVELEQADIPLRAEELVAIQLAAVLLLPLVALHLLGSPLLAVLLALVGGSIPLLLVKNSKVRRKRKFNDQLGDALALMSNSLRAGFSFLQTLDSLQQEMLPPLSSEFNRALREIRYGAPTEEALLNMARRVQSEDMDLIVTAISIQRQVGGNLAEVLDNITHTIKERVRIKGEVKTLTAQGRISGMVIALLPVVLAALIMLINPSYILSLLEHPLGVTLTGAAFFSGLLGAALIRKIVNIEY